MTRNGFERTQKHLPGSFGWILLLTVLVLIETIPTNCHAQNLPSDYLFPGEERLEMVVNIWGEVKKPGLYRVPDGTDLIQLISLAGGPTEFANLKAVKITQFAGSDERVTKLNLLNYLEEKDEGIPPLLKPGDTVRVPKNAKYAWRSAIRTLSEVAMIVGTVYVIYDNSR